MKKTYFLRVFFLITSFVSVNICSATSMVANNVLQQSIWPAIVQNSKNAVVQIFSDIQEFNWAKPCEPPMASSCRGSGFFVDPRGYIVTNYHVIAQAHPVNIQVPILGKKRFEAEVVGCNPDKDVAVIKLTEKAYRDLIECFEKILGITTLPLVYLGDSDNLSESQELMAIGYPLGQENVKISLGHVSGTQHIMGQNLVQTTVPTNPGSSGCPFFDQSGKVVGVCVAGCSAAQNVEYFIPINLVKNLISNFIDQRYKNKVIKEDCLGVSAQITTEDTLKFLGFPVYDCGVRVTNVIKGTQAEKLGVKPGDLIYKIKILDSNPNNIVDELEIDNFGYISVDWCPDKIQILDLVSYLDVGQDFILCAYRIEDGKILDLQFKFLVTGRIDSAIRTKYPEFEDIDYEVVGMIVQELCSNHLELVKDGIKYVLHNNDILCLPEVLKYSDPNESNKKALIITHIYPGSAIAQTRCFSEWDIIDKVNDRKVRTLDEFRDAALISYDTGFFSIETKDGSYAAIPMETLFEKEEIVSYLNPSAKMTLFSPGLAAGATSIPPREAS